MKKYERILSVGIIFVIIYIAAIAWIRIFSGGTIGDRVKSLEDRVQQLENKH